MSLADAAVTAPLLNQAAQLLAAPASPAVGRALAALARDLRVHDLDLAAELAMAAEAMGGRDGAWAGLAFALGQTAYARHDYGMAAQWFSAAAAADLGLAAAALEGCARAKLHGAESSAAEAQAAVDAWLAWVQPQPLRPPLRRRGRRGRARVGLLSGTASAGLAMAAGRVMRALSARYETLTVAPDADRADPLWAACVQGRRVLPRDPTAIAAFAAAEDAPDLLINFDFVGVGLPLGVYVAGPAPRLIDWGHASVEIGGGLFDAVAGSRFLSPAAEGWTTPLLDLGLRWMCYDPPPEAPPPAPRPLSGPVTFGCFNRADKITPQTAALWARVLAAVPGARLVLRSRWHQHPFHQARVPALLAAAGIDLARVEILGDAPRGAFLASYGAVDIALEPVPFPGGLSCWEALWQGVPTVTRLSDHPFGRLAALIVTAVGLPELAAADDDGYVAAAVALAADAPRRATLRRELRDRALASPFMDGAACAALFDARIEALLG